VEIGIFSIKYIPRTAIKSQALANFIVDWMEMQEQEPRPDTKFLSLHFDGSKMYAGSGAGVVITSPKGDKLRYVLQLHFACTNNVAECEALLHGLCIGKEMGISRIYCYGDSDFVVQQVSGKWDTTDSNMAAYRRAVD
jgi:ribonuclease HI